MEEDIEVQSLAEVKQIDSRRDIIDTLDNQIVEHNSNMEIINQQLDTISSNIENINTDINLNEVTDKIDEIDTTIITTQNQDILETLAKQQNKINSIEEKLNIILEKITEG